MPDNNNSGQQPGFTPARRAAAVAGLYTILGLVWIAFSDDLLARLVDDPQQLSQLQTWKGWFYVLITGVLLYFLVHRALKGLVAAHSEVTRAAVDELTGLPGHYRLRRMLADAVERARRQESSTAVIVLDVHQLRRINEAFGISAGDNLLLRMAQRLGEVRASSSIVFNVSRPGSGQFVVVCEPPCDTGQAQHLAALMVESLSQPYQIANGTINASVRAGIAVFPRDGFAGRQLLRAAEMAVFDAKKLRMAVALFRDRSEQLREQLALENDLREALRRRQFQLYFQPLVRISDGCIVGAEALLRWQHPDFGLIPPDRFIPLLEESGDILAVGDWVLREAIRQAVSWQREGEQLSVAVNVSRLQLENKGFIQNVEQAIDESGLKAESLTLEITETLVMTNPEVNMQRMQALHDIGVRLAMDDFGTGYSSLAYLKRYPLDLIKVDRAFVKNIPDDHENDLLMETIVEMSQRLGRKIVAEGVETRREAERLLEIGCPLAQGYLFSRPMEAKDFAEMVCSSRFLTASISVVS